MIISRRIATLSMQALARCKSDVKCCVPHRMLWNSQLNQKNENRTSCLLNYQSTRSNQGGQEQKQSGSDKQLFDKPTLIMFAVGACGIGAYYNISSEIRRENSMAKVSVGQSVGKINIGGPFRLIDHNKKPVTEATFKGKWMFVYFGFTYCPDICPNELIRMRETLNIMEKADKAKSLKVEPIFITIDPMRDGPDQLKAYLSDWHPRFLGLTGTQEQVDDVCKKYRVYYSKAQMGPNPMDYLIDHSVMFYLMGPDGDCHEFYAKNLSPADMAARITDQIDAWDLTH